jgi:hypothetical protein
MDAVDYETPALNADGSFKDANEMEWFHSPSDVAPLNKAPARFPPSPTPVPQAAAWHFMTPIVPSDLGHQSKKRPLPDQEASPGMKKKSSHASTAQATQKRQNRSRCKETQKPPPAITRVKSLHAEGSVETVQGTDDEEIERRKRRK